MRPAGRESPGWLRVDGDVEGLARITMHDEGAPAAQAAALLADIGGRSAAEALLHCLRRHERLCRVEDYDDDRLWPVLEAVNGLGRLRERRAVPELCRLLDGETRIASYLEYRLDVAVLRALVRIGAPEGTAFLLTRLAEDPGSEYVGLLGELNDPAAVVPLLAVLWNLLPGHGVQAIRALGGLRDARTAPALLYLAGSTASSPELRRAALEALVQLPGAPWDTPRAGRDAVDRLWRLLPDPDRETARLAAVLQARTEDGRQSLIGRLRFPYGGHGRPVQESYPSQTACVVACGVVRENPGLFDAAQLRPVLKRLLLAEETPRSVRQAAAEVLGALGDDSAVGTLLIALGSDRGDDGVARVLAALPEPPTEQLLYLLDGAGGPHRRRGAVMALGFMRCTDAGPPLLDMLGPAQPRPLRVAAADALGLIGHRPAAGPLATLVADETETRRLQARAVRALGLIGAPESVVALLSATRSPSEALRLRAAEALGSFSTTAVVARLEEMAEEDDSEIARAAVRSLCRIGSGDGLVLSALVGRAARWPLPMQQMLVMTLADCQAAEATAALGRLLDGPFGDEIRASAVEALGRRRAPESVAALLRYLDDPRTQYLWRGHAARALALTGDEGAVERVVAHFESQRSFTNSGFRDEAREALGMVAADRVTRG
ncbi:HEAT repeat domain-containing protein [Streptomyces paradoxus]|uniref:HEAT repeat domain-containing protein n=1 Tax=Streptomyces paradoxus TaxID=66375 RepID=UPI00363819F6